MLRINSSLIPLNRKILMMMELETTLILMMTEIVGRTLLRTIVVQIQWTPYLLQMTSMVMECVMNKTLMMTEMSGDDVDDFPLDGTEW